MFLKNIHFYILKYVYVYILIVSGYWILFAFFQACMHVDVYNRKGGKCLLMSKAAVKYYIEGISFAYKSIAYSIIDNRIINNNTCTQ